MDLMSRFREWQARPGGGLVVGLGGAAVILCMIAIVGAFGIGHDRVETQLDAASGSAPTTIPSDAAVTDITLAPVEGEALPEGGPAAMVPGGAPAPRATVAPRAGGASPPGGAAAPAGGSQPAGGAGAAPTASAPGETRVGVSATEIKWAVHAPVTFDGAPLNLAEDPIEGLGYYVRYVNENGGINGRKIKMTGPEKGVYDDRYTVDGAKQAADAINGDQPFFVSGTLGVDQIAVIAAEARKRGYPYLAAGGSEEPFKSIGMFQIAASYDTHLQRLAQFLGKEVQKPDSPYFNRKKIGVTRLNSDYIKPAVEVSFRNALQAAGLTLTKVVTINKPTEQTSYASQISDLKNAGVEVVVPAQDPISTSRMVAECATQQCGWKWSVSDFAHESDTALALMGGTWAGVRGLAGGCYYLSENAYKPEFCGAMNRAHEEWVAMDADKEDGWKKDGQGGASAYQIVHIWLTALRSLGGDPTREKLVAALNNQENFSDLVSSPITYKGSPNIAHGAEGMVVYEAQPNVTWKQLTPGFVNSF
ncbi:MAG TPA: ABC transporter substrate-binding protein [Acidimicrobiales bacterium]|nr:ABC transporter substrate-binding protein [Acidimicrobiales bacterium]